MKELEVELEQLRLLVVAVVGREQVGCASGSGGGTVDDKVGEDDEKDARESSPQSGRRLRGGKVTGRRETGHKETGRRETGRKETRRKEMGGKTNGSNERGVGETVAKESGDKEMIVKAMGVRETGGRVSGGKVTEAQVSQVTGGKGDRLMSEREPDNSLPPINMTAGQNVMEGIHQKSYSEAVIEGVRKRARVFVGVSIVRKTNRVLNKGNDVVVCLPGAKIEAITERVDNIVGLGKGGSVLVYIGTNNVQREGTTAIVRKYRNLVRTLKQTWVEQVILAGVIGRRGHRYRNCQGMAINMLVEKLCREEEVGFVHLWGGFVGRVDMYMKDGLHLSGRGSSICRWTLSSSRQWHG